MKMNKVGAKKIIITIWVLLATLIFACLTLISFVIRDETSNPTQRNEIYAFGEDIISVDEYKRYDNYEISSEEGYLSFVKSTWANARIGSVSSSNVGKFDYAGKVIKQTKDIDISHLEDVVIDVFAGTYDGQGHTLKLGKNKSNIHKENNSNIVATNSKSISNEVGYMGGFCNVLLGTARSVDYVEGYEISMYLGPTIYAGGFAGLVASGGTIENIFPLRTVFIVSGVDTQVYIGCIAGYNNGTVKNCYVYGEISISYNSPRDTSTMSMRPFVGAGKDAIYCVGESLTASAVAFEGNGDSERIENPSFISTSVGSNNATSLRNGYNTFPSSAASMEGGASHESGWYKYPNGYYSSTMLDGCMWFRSEIDWATINLTIYPSEAAAEQNSSGQELCYIKNGNIKQSTIEVPAEYINEAIQGYATNGNTLTIFGQQRIAYADNTSIYIFDRWEYNSSTKSFIAHYVLQTFTIRFWESEGVKPTGCTANYLEITVLYDETIEMTETWTANGTTITYKIGNDTVTYVFDSVYKKVSFGEYSVWSDSTNYEVFHIEDDGNDWSKVPNIKELFGSTIFSLNPTMELKTYDTQWGD